MSKTSDRALALSCGMLQIALATASLSCSTTNALSDGDAATPDVVETDDRLTANDLANVADVGIGDAGAIIDASADDTSTSDSSPCSTEGGSPREDVWAPDANTVRGVVCTASMPCAMGLICAGIGCDDIWQCFAHSAGPSEHPCPTDYSAYCGCDGVTFMAIHTCPDRPYQRIGACEDGVNCDPTTLRCSGPEPMCPEGQVPSIVDGNYGACVPYGLCSCEFVWECPHREKYACDTNAKRCGLAPPPASTK